MCQLLTSHQPILVATNHPLLFVTRQLGLRNFCAIIHYLVTTTSKTFAGMKEAIRKKKPQQYSGQDIEILSADYIALAEEIENAGYYSHSLTLNMVDGFLCATQDPKGTFHHKLNGLREKVSDLEQETIFMSTVDHQADKFAQAQLTFRDVCLVAVKCYKELKAINMWEPGKLPKDHQAPAPVHLTKAQVLNLIHNANSEAKEGYKKKLSTGNKAEKGKSGACFNCGDSDHQVKQDCPKPRPSPDRGSQGKETW